MPILHFEKIVSGLFTDFSTDARSEILRAFIEPKYNIFANAKLPWSHGHLFFIT